ncbi:effector binding domain-containing protein [Kingella negevensis]|uniref:GyrI-like domain-containing protein n=1 Tax=Kingella negevensis TaxID=1522312 RepID=UPI0025439D7F|nr:effector binding domain-containing protein [Kingella negevensis]WII93091.1 effector binding domain-containing protein [Kingella negevensis]
MQTSLPIFRVGGLCATISLENEQENINQLWQDWFSGSLKDTLPAFSTSVYCVRHSYQENGSYTLIIGKLISNDATLPENAADVWLPPQQYHTYSLPEKHHSAAADVWQQILADSELPTRRFKTDFETYPAFGEAKIYVGIKGKVEMAEEYF